MIPVYKSEVVRFLNLCKIPIENLLILTLFFLLYFTMSFELFKIVVTPTGSAVVTSSPVTKSTKYSVSVEGSQLAVCKRRRDTGRPKRLVRDIFMGEYATRRLCLQKLPCSRLVVFLHTFATYNYI